MPPIADELRVLVIGDSPLARAGLAALLATQDGLVVSGQVAADTDLNNALTVYRPQVLAWDLGWDVTRALDTLSDLKDAGVPILALLTDEGQAASVLAAGARGLLLNDASADMLTAALYAVSRGLLVLNPVLTAALPTQPHSPDAPFEALTARELEVLNLLAEGLPNKSIALKLKISEHTVKFHVNAIMTKLGVQSRTEAVVRATRLGLIVL